MRYSNMTILFCAVLISLFLLPAVGTAGSSLPSFPYIPYIHWAPSSNFDKSDETNEGLSPDMAEALVRQYMDDHSTGSYNAGEMEDRGTYCLTEISGSDGEVKEVLVIEKEAGKVQSLN